MIIESRISLIILLKHLAASEDTRLIHNMSKSSTGVWDQM